SMAGSSTMPSTFHSCGTLFPTLPSKCPMRRWGRHTARQRWFSRQSPVASLQSPVSSCQVQKQEQGQKQGITKVFWVLVRKRHHTFTPKYLYTRLLPKVLHQLPRT